MELILSFIAIIGMAICLKYFGKALIYTLAACFTPFVAAWHFVAGPKEGRKNAAIIAVCGLVFLGSILFITLF